MTNETTKIPIFAVRTTAGQEKNAAEMIETKVKANNLHIVSILAPEILRGYVFIEAVGPHVIEEAVAGLKHVRSRVPGRVQLSDVERYLVVKPVVEELEVGYTVEVISGPFRGMRAKITKMNRVKQEVTLELLEATFTLPITVHADYVKVIEKIGTQSQRSDENGREEGS